MKKTALVGAIAVVLALVFMISRKQCGNNERKVGAKTTASLAGATHGRVPASQRKVAVPSWLSQSDVKPRKVAGRVVFENAPVEGAIVRLALDPGIGVGQPVAELVTASDGGFDFGPQPAARVNVSAEAPNRTATQVTIALADPRTKPDQIVLALGACKSRIYGAVLDASGGAVAKAQLRAAGLAGAESDASGQYSLCVASNFSQVRVEADGYGTIDVGLRLFGELRYDFVLVPEAVLVGQVITEDQHPVGGARVIALPDPSEGPHHIASGWAFTEDDGRFRIPGLSPGHYRLTAAAEGLATNAPVDAMAMAGTAAHDTTIVVGARARVSGHVVMGDRPISGAQVSAERGGPGVHLFGEGATEPAFSQADGSFVLQGVPFGPVSFLAIPYEMLAPKRLEIKTAKVDDVKIEVGKLASIHGIVTRKGKPIEGAELQGPQVQTPVRSDSTGAYRIEGLPPGEVHFFAWHVDAKAFAQDQAVKVTAGEDKQHDIELDCAGAVKGVVIDGAGKPVGGAYVRLINNEGDVGESMTNARGEFDAGSMSGGEYLPSVYPSPMAGQPFKSVIGGQLDTIKVPKDGEVTGVKLAVNAERFAIRGTVVDGAGSPVADVHIEAIGRGKQGMDLPSIMSTADGTFAIQNLAAGSYNLHAHGSDGSEGDALDVAAGADNVVMKLIRPGAIEGTLVGFSTPPLVQMRTLTTDLFIGGNPIVEGTRFWQTGVRPGKYAIEAKAGKEVAGESVEIRSGETAKVTLKSRAIGNVEGYLYEFATKTSLPGYRCDANLSMGGQMGGPPPDPSWSSSVDDKGHFAMAAPVGMVRVFCLPQGGINATVAGTDVEVTAQNVPKVEVYAVRVKSASQGNAGFRIRPLVLPLVVNAIEPAGAAATQGMKLGDVVMSIDGASLQGVLPMGAMTLLGNHKPGSIVTVGVDRGGTPMTFKLPVTASAD